MAPLPVQMAISDGGEGGGARRPVDPQRLFEVLEFTPPRKFPIPTVLYDYHIVSPLGPLGFNFSQHGPTTRPQLMRQRRDHGVW